MKVAQVLLPLPLEEAFDYAVPEGLEAEAGAHVCVPLGPRLAHGVVLSAAERMGVNRPLKAVEGVLDEPALPEKTLEFVQWAARYAVDAPGCALAIALRGARAPRPRPERRLEATGMPPSNPTPARLKVL
ncbi:MAG TPA: primosomal protein N', partial [Brevundimonas sp.]